MKKSLLGFVTAFACIFVACKDQPKSTTTAPNGASTESKPNSPAFTEERAATLTTIFTNLFDRSEEDSTGPLGMPVKLSDAKPCIDRFGPEMERYGLDKVGGKPISLPPLKTRQRTDTVILAGGGFVAWVEATVNKYDSAAHGANLQFKLALGILDSAFLQRTLPGAPGIKTPNDIQNVVNKRKNRITIFIIPVYRNGHKVQDDPLVFELGGVQP